MFQKLENNKIIKILKNMEKYVVKDNVDSLGEILIIDDKLYFSYGYQKNGSYGKIKCYSDEDSNYFICKRALNDISLKSFIAEIKIHSILSSFQDIYLKNNIIPKIFHIYNSDNSDFKEFMMEKYNEDIYNMFVNIDVNNTEDEYLFLELLYQISTHLRILQKYFNFTHNDLKTNNIFYKLIDPDKKVSFNNIVFIIGDLGGTSINFNNNLISGEVKGLSKELIEEKDIFMLVHIILTFIKKKYKNNFIRLLNKLFNNEVNINMALSNDNIWHKLYTLNEYPRIYKPKNVLKRIRKFYPQFKDFS
tara:strand:+ start:317 stop:1231 length:915 start_codon:yes stop_codon:yes gene_type:complete